MESMDTHHIGSAGKAAVTGIRIAEAGDAQRLAALAEQTFRETFGGANTVEDMNLHCRTRFGEAIQLDEIADPACVTLVCEREEELIAYAQLRWGDAPDCVAAESPGEIHRLYVARSWHGKGVAQELMAACIAQMATHASDVVWLGVWEKNPRAISFYGKCGFIEVGDHIFPLGTDLQRDIILVRPVSV